MVKDEFRRHDRAARERQAEQQLLQDMYMVSLTYLGLLITSSHNIQDATAHMQRALAEPMGLTRVSNDVELHAQSCFTAYAPMIYLTRACTALAAQLPCETQ